MFSVGQYLLQPPLGETQQTLEKVRQELAQGNEEKEQGEDN